jgi:hypothetical protein
MGKQLKLKSSPQTCDIHKEMLEAESGTLPKQTIKKVIREGEELEGGNMSVDDLGIKAGDVLDLGTGETSQSRSRRPMDKHTMLILL